MKISFLPQNYNTPTKPLSMAQVSVPRHESSNLNLMPHYRPISFSGDTGNYKQAKEYLDLRKNELEDEKLDLSKFNLDKLNGIQKGIKLFDKMSMRETSFFKNNLLEIALVRGCHNQCVHCYAGAVPPLREDDKHISKMSWNDFETLTNGIGELNNRLGFKFAQDERGYNTLFHDADCIDITLKDNDGKEHDYIDLMNRVYDVVGTQQIFDTAGWSPKNKVAQARAEKYVEYFSQEENMAKLIDFNISANPFHAMYSRCVQSKTAGDKEKEQKFRELYVDRMANVLLTCTPLLKYPNFGFIARSIDNKSKDVDGYREKDLRKLYREIFSKLGDKYKEDLKGDKKYVKNKDDLKQKLSDYKLKIDYVQTDLGVTKRLEKIYRKDDPMVTASNHNHNLAKAYGDKLHDRKIFEGLNTYGFIDINGKLYKTNFYDTIKTDIQLNYENKDKLTADISPNLQEFSIDEESIEKYLT